MHLSQQSPNTSVMNTPQPDGSTAPPRSTDLLSLLKFRQTSGSAATPPINALNATSPPHTSAAAQNVGPFNFASPPLQSPPAFASTASRPDLRGEGPGSSSSPQDFLLKLLNQAPKPTLAEATPQSRDMAGSSSSASYAKPSTPAQQLPANPEKAAPTVHHGAQRETVSEALSGVGEVVDKQVEEALAQATQMASGDSAPRPSKAEQQQVVEAAKDIKEDLKDDAKRIRLESGMPDKMAQAFEKTIDAVAEPLGTEEDWEKAAERSATTFTLPMQPFKSIHIGCLEEHPAVVPKSMIMDIARVKRPFDQIDRNLVAATQNLMIYPLKNGGLRVIRQETGVHKEVFKQVQERIFNISVSARKKTGQQDVELVLGTGVEGSVFWAPLTGFAASDDADAGAHDNVHGFVFPPVPSGDENTSGGQLKTRVKPSSRHPEYFAYGRGKSIYIVYPNIARSAAYCNSQTHVCKSEKYLKEHTLRISTGKAGKDFIFSADDSLVVSLDKAGRLKFWDIRNLIQDDYEKNLGAAIPLDIKIPLMTLATCPATEKSWPTSIHLVDKEKPMTKGIALRYVIIGLKQNHTLQLWDLMLGKPVQEINFPHSQESDAICSVVFHAKTSILTVAHPTRNSIYFLHLSIPPYALPPMSQSKFVSCVAEKDSSLPQPQSTIIVNGIREYRFSHTATIRSLDILADPGTQYGEEAPSFVLYIMHSNGIMELKVDRSMLGLGETNRLINGISALTVADAIKVENIKPLPPIVPGDTGSVTSETASVAPISTLEESRKPSRKVDQTPPSRVVKGPDAESNTEKPEKKKKKEKKSQHSPDKGSPYPTSAAPAENSKAAATASGEPPKPRILPRKQAEPSEAETADSKATVQSETVTGSSQDLSGASRASSTMDLSVFEALLKAEFEGLQDSLIQDRLKQDAAAISRQEAVLKAVSRTLSENVEDALSSAVTEGLTKVTLSPLKDLVASTIDHQLSTSFNQAMKVGVPRELQKSLPVAIGQVLKDKDVLQGVAAQISQSVTQQVDSQLKNALQTTITPAFSKLAVNAVKQMTSDMERRFGEQIAALEARQQKDNSTIATLQQSIDGLQQAVTSLVQTHGAHQQEVLSTLAEVKGIVSLPPPASAVLSTSSAGKQILSPADLERKEIEDALARNDVEEAALKVGISQRHF